MAECADNGGSCAQTPTTCCADNSVGPALAAVLSRAEALYRDLQLQSVSSWKERTGKRAVGYMPVYVPRELLWAQEVLPVGIVGGGEDGEIIRGDAYYQSYICHIPRSTVELGLNGSLDALDGMIFPATCDVIRNLSGMWKMLFPGKLARYLDVPQNFDPELGGAFYRRELEELSEELHKLGAPALTNENLAAAVTAYNHNRRLVGKLYELRREQPWKVPTSELYLVLRAGFLLPVDEHSEMIEAYLEAVALETDRRPLDQARVVLIGTFCEQPPLGLIKTLERSGCYIVDDDLVPIHRWIRGDISTEGDVLGNLVTAFLSDAMASPIRYIDDQEKGRELMERVKHSGAEGILFGAPSFCDPALLDQPMSVKAADDAGYPWTSFKYSENTGQFQVIREQAGTFADSIKLFS